MLLNVKRRPETGGGGNGRRGEPVLDVRFLWALHTLGSVWAAAAAAGATASQQAIKGNNELTKHVMVYAAPKIYCYWRQVVCSPAAHDSARGKFKYRNALFLLLLLLLLLLHTFFFLFLSYSFQTHGNIRERERKKDINLHIGKRRRKENNNKKKYI
jgi:hypothetical protein